MKEGKNNTTQLFYNVCRLCSKLTTEKYSTSFSSAIRLLHPDLQIPIYNIYGFVRFADEIVDTFHDFNKAVLLAEFKRETKCAIERGISLNPILHSFQETVHEYNITYDLVEAFLPVWKWICSSHRTIKIITTNTFMAAQKWLD